MALNANWIKQTTATTGTGTLTLNGTVSGHIRFQDAFLSGQVVPYLIIDGNNRESGHGTLTSGANWTLARTQIADKLDGGVYSTFPATGISVASGAYVLVGPSSHDLQITTPGSLGPVVTTAASTGHATFTATADRMYKVPFELGIGGKYSSARINVTTAQASSKARIALYTLTTDGDFGVQLFESTDIDTTTTGNKTYTFGAPLVLAAGDYMAVFIANSAIAIRGVGSTMQTRWAGVDASLAHTNHYYHSAANWTSIAASLVAAGTAATVVASPMFGLLP